MIVEFFMGSISRVTVDKKVNNSDLTTPSFGDLGSYKSLSLSKPQTSALRIDNTYDKTKNIYLRIYCFLALSESAFF